MRSARLPRLRGGVCELVMISRVYDDPDEPYGPASAEPYGSAKPRPLRIRTKPRSLRTRIQAAPFGPASDKSTIYSAITHN